MDQLTVSKKTVPELVRKPVRYRQYRTYLHATGQGKKRGELTPFVRYLAFDLVLLEVALDFSKDQIDAIMHEWVKTEQENRNAHRNNEAAYNGAKDILGSLFDPDEFQPEPEQPSRRSNKRARKQPIQISWYDGMMHDLRVRYFLNVPIPRVPRVRAVEIRGRVYWLNNGGKGTLKEAWEFGRQIRQGVIERRDKTDSMLVACVQYAQTHHIDLDGMTVEEIKEVVNDQALDDWMIDNYPKGTEIELAGCGCGKFVIGGQRCACGTHLVHISVDGDLVDGFRIFTQVL